MLRLQILHLLPAICIQAISNGPAEARRANNVEMQTETRNRRCLQPDRQVVSLFQRFDGPANIFLLPVGQRNWKIASRSIGLSESNRDLDHVQGVHTEENAVTEVLLPLRLDVEQEVRGQSAALMIPGGGDAHLMRLIE